MQLCALRIKRTRAGQSPSSSGDAPGSAGRDTISQRSAAFHRLEAKFDSHASHQGRGGTDGDRGSEGGRHADRPSVSRVDGRVTRRHRVAGCIRHLRLIMRCVALLSFLSYFRALLHRMSELLFEAVDGEFDPLNPKPLWCPDRTLKPRSRVGNL